MRPPVSAEPERVEPEPEPDHSPVVPDPVVIVVQPAHPVHPEEPEYVERPPQQKQVSRPAMPEKEYTVLRPVQPKKSKPDPQKIKEKIKEKSNEPLIFSASPPAPEADSPLPIFYKKAGRQRTEQKTKDVILYRVLRAQWPQGLSDYMCWYYDQHYIKKGGKFYAKASQWKRDYNAEKNSKKSNEKSNTGDLTEPQGNLVLFKRKAGQR